MPVALPEHTQGIREDHQTLINVSKDWPNCVFNAVIAHYFAYGSVDASLLFAEHLLQTDQSFYDLISFQTR